MKENRNAALQGRDNRAPGEQQRAANEECERMRTTNNERGTSQTQKEAATAEGVTRKQNDKEDCIEVRGGEEIKCVEPTTAAGSQGVFTSPVVTSNIFGVLEGLDDGTEGVHEGVRGEPDTNQQRPGTQSVTEENNLGVDRVPETQSIARKEINLVKERMANPSMIPVLKGRTKLLVSR